MFKHAYMYMCVFVLKYMYIFTFVCMHASMFVSRIVCTYHMCACFKQSLSWLLVGVFRSAAVAILCFTELLSEFSKLSQNEADSPSPPEISKLYSTLPGLCSPCCVSCELIVLYRQSCGVWRRVVQKCSSELQKQFPEEPWTRTDCVHHAVSSFTLTMTMTGVQTVAASAEEFSWRLTVPSLCCCLHLLSTFNSQETMKRDRWASVEDVVVNYSFSNVFFIWRPDPPPRPPDPLPL